MECSGCVAEACMTCVDEAHCDLIEEVCTVCRESEGRDEVEGLLRQVKRCQRKGDRGHGGGFGAPGDGSAGDPMYGAF